MDGAGSILTTPPGPRSPISRASAPPFAHPMFRWPDTPVWERRYPIGPARYGTLPDATASADTRCRRRPWRAGPIGYRRSQPGDQRRVTADKARDTAGETTLRN